MKPGNQNVFSEMVEATVEKTSEYYNKYRKHFRYAIRNLQRKIWSVKIMRLDCTRMNKISFAR